MVKRIRKPTVTEEVPDDPMPTKKEALESARKTELEIRRARRKRFGAQKRRRWKAVKKKEAVKQYAETVRMVAIELGVTRYEAHKIIHAVDWSRDTAVRCSNERLSKLYMKLFEPSDSATRKRRKR